jgi:hypothetical protein
MERLIQHSKHYVLVRGSLCARIQRKNCCKNVCPKNTE